MQMAAVDQGIGGLAQDEMNALLKVRWLKALCLLLTWALRRAQLL